MISVSIGTPRSALLEPTFRRSNDSLTTHPEHQGVSKRHLIVDLLAGKQKTPQVFDFTGFSDQFWRRGWDSNPRYGGTVRLISSQVQSTTLPPLRCPATAVNSKNFATAFFTTISPTRSLTGEAKIIEHSTAFSKPSLKKIGGRGTRRAERVVRRSLRAGPHRPCTDAALQAPSPSRPLPDSSPAPPRAHGRLRGPSR
jgi:hypothetical protein